MLAGEAFAQVVDRFGWQTAQAIYERGDVTRSLTERELVGEFMTLMGEIADPIAQIRAVDATLASRVTRETWGRSHERLNERKAADAARKRIADRLAAL